MKNLKNLGKNLNRKEQKAINGGVKFSELPDERCNNNDGDCPHRHCCSGGTCIPNFGQYEYLCDH